MSTFWGAAKFVRRVVFGGRFLKQLVILSIYKYNIDSLIYMSQTIYLSYQAILNT